MEGLSKEYKQQIQLWLGRMDQYARQYELPLDPDHEEQFELDSDSEHQAVRDVLAVKRCPRRMVKRGTPSTPLGTWLQKLALEIRLTEAEKELIYFVCMMSVVRRLRQRLNELQFAAQHQKVNRMLAAVLDVDVDAVTHALADDGVLLRGEMLRCEFIADEFENRDIVEQFICDQGSPYLADLLSVGEGLERLLQHPGAQVLDQLLPFGRIVPRLELRDAVGECAKSEKEIALRLLRQKNLRRPFHLAITGEDSARRSGLAKELIHAAGMNAYELRGRDSDGDPISPHRTIRELKRTQAMLSRHENFVVIVPRLGHGNSSMEFLDMGSLPIETEGCRRTLEGLGPHHVIWLGEKNATIGPQIVVEMDLRITCNPLSRKQRKRWIRKATGTGVVSTEWVDQWACRKTVPIEVIDAAVRTVGDLANAEGKHKQPLSAVLLDQLVQQKCDVLEISNPVAGHGKRGKKKQGIQYSPDLSNTDTPLSGILKGIRKAQQENRTCPRILCYGPPGTGKTAYAHEIARAVNRPLLQMRASDMLGPYVGQTEAQISDTFEQADLEGAVLLIDEADSFFYARKSGNKSWENTQVNEMLTQLESFDGIFVASTNLLEVFDSAAMRRFDIKLRFNYLRPEQVVALGLATLKTPKKCRARVQRELEQRLAGVDCLAPGDFEAVRRGADAVGETLTVDKLVSELCEATKLKPEWKARRGIGFTAELET